MWIHGRNAKIQRNSKIQGFKNSRIQKFKDSRIQRNSKIQRFDILRN
jgi:hypothetical protein